MCTIESAALVATVGFGLAVYRLFGVRVVQGKTVGVERCRGTAYSSDADYLSFGLDMAILVAETPQGRIFKYIFIFLDNFQ